MNRAGPRAAVPDGWLFFALLALITWLPLPVGSNRPWSWGLMEVAAFSLLSVWLFVRGRATGVVTAGLRQDYGILLLLSLWLAYQLLQALPLPIGFVSALSPAAGELHQFAAAEGLDRYASLSLDPGLTLNQFLKAAAYVAIFVLVLVLTNTRERVRALCYLLVFVVLGDTLWAFAAHYLAGRSEGARFSGTYVNANHFAGLLEIGISLTLGLWVALGSQSKLASPRRPGNWRERLSGLTRGENQGSGALTYAILVAMIAALLLSASRGGLVSVALGLLATLVLVVILRGRRTREARLLPVVGLAILVAGTLFGADSLTKRMARVGFTDETRSLLREGTFSMIRDFPLFGAGSGNWELLYPKYKDPGVHASRYRGGYAAHAENDHLQLLAEQGVIGYLLVGGAIGLALGQMAVGMRQRRDPLMRGILFGCMAASLSLLIHAWVDFNFHIPANAAWFYVVLALGLVASRRFESISPEAGERAASRREENSQPTAEGG